MGKARVRFNNLTVDDAAAIINAAHAHNASPTGAPDDWNVPAELAERLSTLTYKYSFRT